MDHPIIARRSDGYTGVHKFSAIRFTFVAKRIIFGSDHQCWWQTLEFFLAGRWRSLAEWCRLPTAAIWAARCATLPTSAISSAFGPHLGAFRTLQLTWAGRPCPLRVPWREMFPIARFFSAFSRALTGSLRSQSISRGARSRSHSGAASKEFAWPCSRILVCRGILR